jgi:hypothetical protein
MHDDTPDARDGLTRKGRVVLGVLTRLQADRGGRFVPLPMLYGHVLEQVGMSIGELQAIVARLGARRHSRATPRPVFGSRPDCPHGWGISAHEEVTNAIADKPVPILTLCDSGRRRSSQADAGSNRIAECCL